MDTSKQYRIAMVLKTDGLQYDDRVRKEVQTIQRLYPNISFKIFPMLPNNEQIEGITDYGVPYKSIYCKTRSKYPSKSHLLRKALDFYRVAQRETHGFDVVWCADPEAFAVAALIKTPHLIWDLHEIPSALTRGKIRKGLLQYIFRRCDVILHANPQRIDYLESVGCIKDKSKHYAIRNYPQFEDVNNSLDESYMNFMEWKGSRKCVYLQGTNGWKRADIEVASALMSFPDLVAVVVGGFDNNTKQKLFDTYGKNTVLEKFYFVGRVPQLKTPLYINKCSFSIVFYKQENPGLKYCEANRFYQSVVCGIPVVTGNNPPMRELMLKYEFGVCIDDDGKDIEKIKEGISKLLTDYNYYLQKVNKNRYELLWEKQDASFSEIIEKVFD